MRVWGRWPQRGPGAEPLAFLPTPVARDLVLVGAGHAHVRVLRHFAMRPIPGLRITLITREVASLYSGMLPGVVAGLYEAEAAHIDVWRLARFAGARILHAEATGIDPARRLVLCRDRPAIAYDLLSLDIGGGSARGAGEGLSLKPIGAFLTGYAALLGRLRPGQRVTIVGGGAGGTELALALAAHLPPGVTLTLATGARGLLPGFPERFRDRLARHLTASRVTIDPRHVTTESGPRADELIWATEATPAPWLRDTGLAVDAEGFLAVDRYLRVGGRPDVFAAGDTASFAAARVPRSGVYAVRAGATLAANLRAILLGRPLRPFRPQRRALYLISTGTRHAVGTRNGLVFAGTWVWRWKDRLDRRFVERHSDLAMPQPQPPRSPIVGAPPAVAMRCAGCGGKVGAGVLARALAGLHVAPRNDVLVGLAEADDAAVIDTGGATLAVHSVDSFRAMLDDPWLFGRIAATHALGDLYAMGATPQTALALVALPHAPPDKQQGDLAALMQGANEALTKAGCTLVGGHTAEASELTLGFAVNGTVSRDATLTKAGARPGAALLLTKPLGTGTLLAADMRGLAPGRWMVAAIARMQQPAADAATLLRDAGAQAMTDVTGFGLAGHLLELLRASGVSAILDLDAIPVLPGAQALAAAGIASTLAPANRDALAAMDITAVARHPTLPLLFDPQTGGGLLAALAEESAGSCLDALRAAGYAAAQIGRVTEASGSVRLIGQHGRAANDRG